MKKLISLILLTFLLNLTTIALATINNNNGYVAAGSLPASLARSTGPGGATGLSEVIFGGDWKLLYPTPTLIPIPDNKSTTQPEPGKALIIFLHPQSLCANSTLPKGRSWYDSPRQPEDPSSGWNMYQPALFDGEKFMGILFGKTHLSYQAKPGKHLFTIAATNIDFLSADLKAGQTYYVYANYAECTIPHGTWINAGIFKLIPVNAKQYQNEIKLWMSQTSPTLFTEEQTQWLRYYAADIKQKRNAALKKWQQLPASKRTSI